MTVDFNNKVIAITGAGKGLGRAYAMHLAELGASVVVNNRRHEGETLSSADRVVDEIVNAGGKAVAEYSSVEDVDSGDKLLAVALENFGRLDGLVANAGVMESGGTFRKQSIASLREVLEINLMGTINVVHPVFRHFCEQQSGSIVVCTSSAGLFGEFGLPAYSVSKAAVIGLMYSLSLEGAAKNVQVNAIAPYAATQMTDGYVATEVFERLDSARVAPHVAQLLSGAINGEILISGGGRVARARMQTTMPTTVPDVGSIDFQTLVAAPMELDFKGARENFEDFVAGLDSDV